MCGDRAVFHFRSREVSEACQKSWRLCLKRNHFPTQHHPFCSRHITYTDGSWRLLRQTPKGTIAAWHPEWKCLHTLSPPSEPAYPPPRLCPPVFGLSPTPSHRIVRPTCTWSHAACFSDRGLLIILHPSLSSASPSFPARFPSSPL